MTEQPITVPPMPTDPPKTAGKPPRRSPWKASRDAVGAARDTTSKSVNVALDVAGKPFVPVAARWELRAAPRRELRTDANLNALTEANAAHLEALRDLRRDRKAFETARSEVKWFNVLNGERRAARAVVRDSQRNVKESAAARREARKAYPLTLPALAARCHAAHLLPTSVWSAFSDSYASTGAVAASVAAVALTALGVPLGKRRLRNAETPVADPCNDPHLTDEERELCRKLTPEVWHRLAAERGLSDAVVTAHTHTPTGLQVRMELNNQMTLDKLKDSEPLARAALRLKEGTGFELRPGEEGGRVRATLRTRNDVPDFELTGWKPGDPWGVNLKTGESVHVPLGRRMLVAGMSGSGKSWSFRPVLAEASAYDDHVLVVIDLKRFEANNWSHRARVAKTMDEVLEVTEELVAEMEERADLTPRGEDVFQITSARPRITVFVDEGAEVIARSEGRNAKKEHAVVMDHLRSLAAMGRASEIIILWATQKPTLTGNGRGLDTMISAQISCRASLCVSTSAEARVIFGDDATAKGWDAHELPMPGVAMLRDNPKAKPDHIRTRAFSPKDVIALPDHTIWSRRASFTGATASDVRARKAAESPSDPWAVPPTVDTTVILGSDIESADSSGTKSQPVSAADRDDLILAELNRNAGTTMSSVARKLGLAPATVKRSLERLELDGLSCRDENGGWHPVP